MDSPADIARHTFLLALDNAGFEITDWEAEFLADQLDQPRPLTPAQQRAIDDLITKYASLL